jgi:hypothetical protein
VETVIARALDDAAARIRHTRRRSSESLVLAAFAAAWAGLAAVTNTRLAVALGVGVAFELAAAVWFALTRRGLIAGLAVEPDAYVLPEVRAYGAQIAGPRPRRDLAVGIRKMVREAVRPDSLYLGERVQRYARDLEALAHDLTAPGVRVHPASVAACRRFLSEAAESPLYNPRLPEDDIPRILRRIRAGIQRDDAQAA